MHYCNNCDMDFEGDVCPRCGLAPASMKKKKDRKIHPSLESRPEWPRDEKGELELAVLLEHVGSMDGQADIACAMLWSYGIPALIRYPRDGSFGKVVLGFSGYGADLYVPQSRLEEATALLHSENSNEEETRHDVS